MDEYWPALQQKLLFIKDLQDRFDGIPVIIAGDLFQDWDAGPDIERWCIQNLFHLIVIPGQHDLPYHNLEMWHQSSLAVLNAADPYKFVVLTNTPYSIVTGPVLHGYAVTAKPSIVIYPFPWTVPPKNDTYQRASGITEIAVCHHLIEADWPGAESEGTHDLLKRLDYDLILTGDNHKTFVDKTEDQLLINPGSLMRRAADQIDHQPRVYLWSMDNEFEAVDIPIQDGVVTREHVEKEEQREERIEAYVVRLDDDYEVGLSFEKNLGAHFKKNKTHKRVQEMAWEDVA
jgi:DNA repair exonuclease SbcCD nuclease subunit